MTAAGRRPGRWQDATSLCELGRNGAGLNPDDDAFRCGDDAITHGRLVDHADRLAAALVANGVKRGDRVGIMATKSVWNAVAVYGIHRAGAAYVPLDPSAPLSRHLAIIADCGIRHLVTDGQRPKRLLRLGEERSGITNLYGVDSAEHESQTATPWAEVVAHDPLGGDVAMPGPDDPAYIIFTSGSTGVPKGIVHNHRSAVAYATMAADLYDLGPDDRLSNFPPLHFDQSTFDFFSGPAVGATTVMIGEQHQRMPASLSTLMEVEKLSIWYSVPFALIQLLMYGVLDQRDLTSLRWVIYGGEPFPIKHLHALMTHWPQARFSNCYGPAETNQCSYHHLDPSSAVSEPPAELPSTGAQVPESSVPIGVMCPGMSAAIVDGDDNDVADGEPGELLVNSPTTMAGYWNRPEVNARVLVDRQGKDGEPITFYRTGDLVRRNDDGLLDFLGRKDRQVKIRGYRVELDEIESVLADHESVQEAAVIAVSGEGEPGSGQDGPRLVACVLPASSSGPASEGSDMTSALRRHLSAALPKYAVPAEVRVVGDFPRTTSQKIDYRALATSIAGRIERKQG